MDPRTILYIGNYRRSWCTEVHLAASLGALGHRVVQVQEDTCDWESLPDLADREGAHMLLWTRTWPAEMDRVRPVLRELRARGVPSVAYHLDLFLGLDREHQVTDQPFFACDLLVTPHLSGRWAELGVNHLWQPPGVFHAETDPVPPAPRVYPWDVVFVGSHPYPHPEWEPTRTALIEAFKAEFGGRFKVLPERGKPLRGRDLQTLYATVPVVLGDSCLAGQVEGYWSDRVPETLGRGGFLIHPAIGEDIAPEGAWYADGAHLAVYFAGRPNEAIDLALAALERPDERAAIADQGRDLVLSRDTYVHRMAAMLAHVENTIGWREPPAAPPTPRPARTVRRGRWQARFEPRPGDVGAVDESVISEVWTADDYRIPAAGFRGTVLDIGGNIGAFAVLAAKAGGRRVVTVEPHPENRARLLRHVELNRAGVVEVDPRALGSVDGGSIVLTGNGGGAHAVDGENAGTEGTLIVETVRLDTLLAGLGQVEFLKVDIEGGEYEAFEAVTASQLHDRVELLALEYHGPGMPHLAHLNDDGYHLERWGALVAKLADCGHVEIHGHPMVGGLLWWKRY